jgi:acyl-CoA reductase-like NAD-dependent aldehyde dehydrogenase
MTATQRGALLRKLGDLIAMHAEQLVQTEVRDNGKLIAEMLGQTRYVPQWHYYFGGLADKIEGGVQSIDKPGVFKLHSTGRIDYIAIGKSEGAEVVLGGGPVDKTKFGEGWFVEPTIFTGADNRMRIAQEEIFGPALTVSPFASEEEAIAIASDTVYGLAAGVWTQSMRRALLMSERLRAGTVSINTYRAVSFMSPFGGYKRSGLGRESGQEAIYEYLQQKSVWISTATEVPNLFVLR